MTEAFQPKPDQQVSVADTFGFESTLHVDAFSERNDYVPDIDPAYVFNREVTLAVLSGFTHNRRVLIAGLHGTGKSSHIEQIAARLNWPCLRVNLDGHISRFDLVGKDTITLKDGQQITEFQEGIVPWSLQRPVALVFDELDAARPEVMFVIQRVLEREGKFTLLDQNRVITPHPYFRLLATSNTVGLGNLNGLYHGSQLGNQAQIDRWNVVALLDYLEPDIESAIVCSRVPEMCSDQGRETVNAMVAFAGLTRNGFEAGDLSTLMSPRTVIAWAENLAVFERVDSALRYSYLNKCDPSELALLGELYQRCFDQELSNDRC